MAAELSVKTIMKVTGLGNDLVKVHGWTSATTPTELASGLVSCGTTAGNIDLGDIAAGKGIILWFRATTGNFYLKIGATSGDPVLTDSHLYVLEGESYALPINPNSTAVPGVRYIGSSASSVFEYSVVGKA